MDSRLRSRELAYLWRLWHFSLDTALRWYSRCSIALSPELPADFGDKREHRALAISSRRSDCEMAASALPQCADLPPVDTGLCGFPVCLFRGNIVDSGVDPPPITLLHGSGVRAH